jgi:HK97 family phage major capsid protein
MLTKAIGWTLDDAFLNGHGAGQPLGVLNCPCLIEVAKESSQTAATIVYENIINMFSRLHPNCMSKAKWVCSITAMPQLMQLYFSVGAGGNAVPVLQETTGKFTLLGKEVLFTEKLPVLGQKGDIMLCDFSQYAVGLREELRIEKSNAPGFSTDESTWRTVCRADGMGTWDTTLTLKDGSTTVSPFITLAERT